MAEEEGGKLRMSGKLNIAVVMGGPSKEHEVSLSSGQAILENLDTGKYHVATVVISKSGKWSFGDDSPPLTLAAAISRLKKLGIDVVMLALHGTFGEDGTIQAVLERRGLAYTGSSSVSSLLAMDKLVSEAMYEEAGLAIPRSLSFSREDEDVAVQAVGEALSYPLIVKPVRQGSSIGVHIVREAERLPAAFKDAAHHDQRVMVQELIEGREVSCGVLEQPETGRPFALPPTELIPQQAEFFDYEAKYTPGRTLEITPPEMPKAAVNAIQRQAVMAHELLGCRGYSRTDFIIQGRTAYIIETNTLPGMTKTSILPQQAAAAGMTFGDLLDRIIECASAAHSV